ncbi:MAG: phosphate acyltransferase PlsX [Gemmataceae bacterium]|nr:phosphate acyltransferase PlsX [Gemmataceae bacterium]
MRIALDAMGGDHAPGPIVGGAMQALESDPELHVVLVGDQAQIDPLIQGQCETSRVSVLHCTQVVGMEDSPVEALRRKPDNSIARSWQLLGGGKVEGIVSAGNTGAMVAGGVFSRRFLKNVRRPGIGTVMPTKAGWCVMIDVGANTQPKAEHLYQYGVMGSIFARCILQVENPRIGLMNIGSEGDKGNSLAKETNGLFNASPLQKSFIGNVEGRDIHQGIADVVVCDGFVGNVVLKVCEGLYQFLMEKAAQEILAALKTERDLAKEALKLLASRYDYSEFGGAPLLGIDGVCIICHGSSGDRAIKNALLLAAKYVRLKLNDLIVHELEQAPAFVAG